MEAPRGLAVITHVTTAELHGERLPWVTVLYDEGLSATVPMRALTRSRVPAPSRAEASPIMVTEEVRRQITSASAGRSNIGSVGNRVVVGERERVEPLPRPRRVGPRRPSPRKGVIEVTGDQVIEAIRRWEREFGSPPKAAEWSAPSRPSWVPSREVARKRFGSWANAVEAAGFRRPVQNNGRWTRDAIVGALREFRASEGRWPTMREFKGRGGEVPDASRVAKVFGSWRQALEAAE